MNVNVIPAVFLALVFVLTKIDNGVTHNQNQPTKSKLEQVTKKVVKKIDPSKKTFQK